MAGLINTVSGSIPSTGLSSNVPIRDGNNDSGLTASSFLVLNAATMNNSVKNLNKLQHGHQQQQQQQQNGEYPRQEQNFMHHLPSVKNHNSLYTAPNQTINAANTNNVVNNVLTTTCENNSPANTYLWIVTPVAAR